MTLKFVLLTFVIAIATAENEKWSNERGRYIFLQLVYNALQLVVIVEGTF